MKRTFRFVAVLALGISCSGCSHFGGLGAADEEPEKYRLKTTLIVLATAIAVGYIVAKQTESNVREASTGSK